jgi:hypothetical protein
MAAGFESAADYQVVSENDIGCSATNGGFGGYGGVGYSVYHSGSKL